MLQLNLSSEPRWVDLGHGVRVCVSPLTTSVMMAARKDAAILEAVEAQGEAVAEDEAIAVVVAKAVGRALIREWEGVSDAEGNPAPVSPDNVDALFDIWPMFEAFQEQIVAGAMLVDAEKNG